MLQHVAVVPRQHRMAHHLLRMLADLVPFAAPMSLTVPRDPQLVGVGLSVQGFALGSGPCGAAALRLSDTVVFAIQ